MLNNLTSIKKKRKRVGRGISAGGGKTAGRGTKGQKSRAGKKLRATFEGGQTSLFERIPKLKGFKNINRINYQAVNVRDIEKKHTGSTVTVASLYKEGLVSKKNQPVKILSKGDISKKFEIQVEAISTAALEKIQKAGGSFTSTSKSKKQTKERKNKKTAENKTPID